MTVQLGKNSLVVLMQEGDICDWGALAKLEARPQNRASERTSAWKG